MMSFNIRPMPLVLSLIITSVLLFGGWFAYNSLALQKPFDQILSELPGVELAESRVLRDEVIIEMRLTQEANLREIMQQIKSEGEFVINGRDLQVKITNDSSQALDRWWSMAMFDIAQAMEAKQYSMIPKTLADRQEQLAGLQVNTEMDDTYVYIQLTHEQDSKFIMLPRIAQQLEVWQHE